MPYPFIPTERPKAPESDDDRLGPVGERVTALCPAEMVYSNRFFSIIDRAGYFTLEYENNDVVIIPIIEDREIVMLRPFRPVLEDAPLEFPGGGGSNNELPVETAARELMEETGLAIDDLSRFKARTPFCLSPNRMPRLHHVFEVRVTAEEADRMKPDGEEIYSIERYSLEEAEELIASGTIYVAAVAGILASWLFSRKASSRKARKIKS
jgi:ADP-ribose pyrophosphatase